MSNVVILYCTTNIVKLAKCIDKIGIGRELFSIFLDITRKESDIASKIVGAINKKIDFSSRRLVLAEKSDTVLL